jgi:hypothetical protein
MINSSMEDEFEEIPKDNKKVYLIGGLILLILILIFIIVPMASSNYFGVIDVPGTNDDLSQVLVIGDLSIGERVVFDNLSHEFNYSTRTAKDLENNSIEELNKYDIILIDQSATEKSVSADLGSAINEYVIKGGNLIIIKNSAIKQSLGIGGITAIDSIGWQAIFGDISPAECILLSGNEPSCEDGKELAIVARIIKSGTHDIMYGIDIAPPVGYEPYSLNVLPIGVNVGAKTIAYFDVENTPATYPAIIEKKSLLSGSVVYFNYDPGFTPTILKNTLNYLK